MDTGPLPFFGRLHQAAPDRGLSGPAAFAWCTHGVFSVSVTAMADSLDTAQEEVETVLGSQLDRLPPD